MQLTKWNGMESNRFKMWKQKGVGSRFGLNFIVIAIERTFNEISANNVWIEFHLITIFAEGDQGTDEIKDRVYECYNLLGKEIDFN